MAGTKQLHIEAMQSAMPGQATKPGRSRAIAVGAAPLRREALQSRLRVVLYYRTAAGGDDSAEAVGAWAKESLSAALAEHPELAGRLRNDREGGGFWDVKLNDAGVRLVQASAAGVAMDELLGSERREAMEEKLAYWKDIDRDEPDVSALFYIQVTGFKGDGYSIGITCSLLLADPQLLARFLKKWALCHSQTVALTVPRVPIFHLSYFRKAKQRSASVPLDSATATATATLLFKLPWDPEKRAPPLAYSTLASLCLDEAARSPGAAAAAVSEFFLIVSDPAEDSTKIELCQKEEEEPSRAETNVAVAAASWDEFGLDGLALARGNRPVHVSCRVVSSRLQAAGLVVVTLPPDDVDSAPELMIAAMVPKRM